jgi:hypothetical protein
MKKVVLFFLLFIALSYVARPHVISSIQAEVFPVLINQIMIGQNEGAKNEFVELYNPNNFAINLEGYALKKKSASGSESNLVSNKAFIGTIGPQSYFLISSPEFGLQIKADLNYSTSNSLSKNNTIILYDNNKEIADKIGYGEVVDFCSRPAILPENNQILKRIKTNINSPNNFSDFIVEEKFIQINNSKGDIININNYQEEIISSEKNIKTSKVTKVPQISDLKNYKNYQNGDLLIIEGIVSVLPGSLGTQYFYIHNKYPGDNNVYGLQIYNYNKKFPHLKLGDKIIVSGELSVTESSSILNYKLKTKELEDIKILSKNNEIILGEIEKSKNLKITEIGQLKKVKGEITQNKTNQIYLDDDNEVLIEIKKGTGISSKTLKEGQEFIVSGILNYSSDKPKLTIINEKHIEPLQEENEKPLGEILDNEFWELEKKSNAKKILKYLITTIILGIAFIIFNKKIIIN